MASASGSSAPPSLYIHTIPASVLEDFCQKMDCLNDYDWMRFASYIITDQTELRKIKLMEKAGISITRELMWCWGVKLATVQQLLEILQELQLFRAAQIIEDWKSVSLGTEPVELPQQEDASLQPGGRNSKATADGRKTSEAPNSETLPVSPLPRSIDLPHSLQSNPPASTNGKPCSAAIPQQETIPDLLSVSLLWTPQEVEVATHGFSKENQITEGIFATTYKGWRDNTVYVVKRLKEQNETQKFFRTEVQICFRCCHPNILRLLGFSVDGEAHCLIYPYMPNGSLMDRLQCQGGSAALTWEQRIRISLGLIKAIQHLHNFGIIHGNVKSSNVLLDENFAPQLGHSGLRLHPAQKKTERATMKTKVMHASLAYFPEDFVRHGQLTEKADIFGCGIVLMEILTGMKAVDEGRQPLFLKDILLDEIQAAKELFCTKDRTFERHAATEICRKYQDRQAVHLQSVSAIYMATAACVCLRKKNANIEEVCEIMEIASYQNPYQRGTERRYAGLSVNIPEETNDEPPSPFNFGFSDDHRREGRAHYRFPNNADCLPPLIKATPTETDSQHILRVPCESDESSYFSWDPARHGACQPPNNQKLDMENISSVQCLADYPENNSDFTVKTMDSKEITCFSNGAFLSNTEREDCGAACPLQALVKEIKINDKKKEMMEQFLLYEENKLSSSELFNF